MQVRNLDGWNGYNKKGNIIAKEDNNKELTLEEAINLALHEVSEESGFNIDIITMIISRLQEKMDNRLDKSPLISIS